MSGTSEEELRLRAQVWMEGKKTKDVKIQRFISSDIFCSAELKPIKFLQICPPQKTALIISASFFSHKLISVMNANASETTTF